MEQVSCFTCAEATLRKYMTQAVSKLAHIDSWDLSVTEECGQSDLLVDVASVPHKATRLFEQLHQRGAGVPLRTGPLDLYRSTYSGVNDKMAHLAPPEAMQFDKALQRVLTKLVHADPRYRPTWLAKIDITDGFYRIRVQPRDIP